MYLLHDLANSCDTLRGLQMHVLLSFDGVERVGEYGEPLLHLLLLTEKIVTLEAWLVRPQVPRLLNLLQLIAHRHDRRLHRVLY